MAYKCYNKTYVNTEDMVGYIKDFICDTDDDVANLPECLPKSTALVADGAEVHIVNASGAWVPFG